MFNPIVDRLCHHEVKLWRLLVMDCTHSRCVGGSDMPPVIGNSHRCSCSPREGLAAPYPTDIPVVLDDDNDNDDGAVGDGQCAGSKPSQLNCPTNTNASAKSEVARAERHLVYGRLR